MEDLGELAEFPDGTPVLKKAAGARLACVRRGSEVCVIDDRCPHEGYPLSTGTVRDGVLTCEWHNWKFDLSSGECTFGGEPVRRYPTRVENGRVHVDLAVDEAHETARITASLREGVKKGEPDRALRDALRLGGIGRGFSVLVADGAARAPWGFDHGLAVTADLAAWAAAGLVPEEEAYGASDFAIIELFSRIFVCR